MRAFVFPGQGSQSVGMGRDLAEAYPQAREVFEEADRVLQMPLSRICFEGPEEQLRLTEFTQPAILTVSVAAFRVFGSRAGKPDLVAGHSLGEYSALVCAGALPFQEAVELVRHRGRFMQEAVPVGQGSMAAVIGLSEESVEEICRAAAGDEVVSPANVNSPGQVVISGHSAAVGRASEAARSQGGKAIPLPVSAPFHCALMNPAQERLRPLIERLHLTQPHCPLINNVEARAVVEVDDIREGLIRQVSSTVRWSQSVGTMVAAGASSFFEIGPGKVLTNLIKKIAPQVETRTIGTQEQIEAYG